MIDGGCAPFEFIIFNLQCNRVCAGRFDCNWNCVLMEIQDYIYNTKGRLWDEVSIRHWRTTVSGQIRDTSLLRCGEVPVMAIMTLNKSQQIGSRAMGIAPVQ